jgi:exodeoxyribonuclease-1
LAEALGLDGDLHRRHLAALRQARSVDAEGFVSRIQTVWAEQSFPPRSDPDLMLYDGFLGEGDRKLCEQAINDEPASLAGQSFPFSDQRLPELLFRYRARNFPETLSETERAQWQEHCQLQRSEGSFTLAQFEQALAEERARPEVNERTVKALDQLEAWVRSLCVGG